MIALSDIVCIDYLQLLNPMKLHRSSIFALTDRLGGKEGWRPIHFS